jgi:hypothetical protein
MPVDHATFADLLPGDWAIGATNFPMWLDGSRLSPKFSYELLAEDPLELGDRVSYVTASGKAKTIVGVDRLRGDEFVWRGKGLLAAFTSRWSVAGVGPDGRFLVIRFSKSIATPAGIDIVVAAGVDSHGLRTLVASAAHEYGLSPEEFASLTWLELPAER